LAGVTPCAGVERRRAMVGDRLVTVPIAKGGGWWYVVHCVRREQQRVVVGDGRPTTLFARSGGWRLVTGKTPVGRGGGWWWGRDGLC
jgi:hypothetical protein